MRELLDEVRSALEGGEPAALVTLVGEQGSTPRSVGARMLVRADGSAVGTIGGGRLEARMTDAAQRAIEDRGSRVVAMSLDGRSVDDEEMLCGGAAEALVAYVPPGDSALTAVCRGVSSAVEARRRAWLFTLFDDGGDGVAYCLLDERGETIGEAPCPAGELRRLVGRTGVHRAARLEDGRRVHVESIDVPETVYICGAGHVARALAPVTRSVGFEVVVLDDRPEFASRDRFPDADRILVVDDFDGALSDLDPDEHGFVVIVTRGHRHDFSVLVQALRTPAAYVGLMSSRSKRERIEAGLREAGFGDEDIARVRMPIGLAIGAESPAELAISILAEMIETRARRTHLE